MKGNKKHEKKVRRMIVACLLCAIILMTSTYAWFIGMKTVNVSAFDVKIASIDGLQLSLNGKDWFDSVYIGQDNFNDTSVVYTGNTNSWGGDGLVPMSSAGQIDTNVSRLILFEKGSITTTPGGYRLMASRVTNYQNNEPEERGYVAFDLFIKNLSGNEYYTAFNQQNEEAIYLTTESNVTVGSAGQAGTGIENSVRVAFAQIGRVKNTADQTQAVITGINCTGGGTGNAQVTGICSRNATIWEPNDKAHVANAINWYSTSCKKRTGVNITTASAYNGTYGTCKAVTNGTYVQTYAISGVINYTDNVDVYDGIELNGYNATTSLNATNGKLVAYNYFTDTEKSLTGVERPELLTLAPNSITKVRIYIWLEGQDIDNYDFASLGKQIQVSFGFTKERFYGEDVNYTTANGEPELANSVKDRESASSAEAERERNHNNESRNDSDID